MEQAQVENNYEQVEISTGDLYRVEMYYKHELDNCAYFGQGKLYDVKFVEKNYDPLFNRIFKWIRRYL